ncbi:hypothetical protein [Nonomuraea africana]|uniref:hypothetical protein n=1 Tax=Nonomuraea africana TaxID=46171 RepID=UPI0037A1A42A
MLGIFGVITGQLVSAWREDRRWRRELAREDLRWEREQQKEAQSRANEADVHWRNERLRVYSGFVGVVREWSALVGQAWAGNPARTAIPADLSRMRELNAQAEKLISEMGLIQESDQVLGRCYDFVFVCSDALRQLEAHVEQGSPAVIDRGGLAEVDGLSLFDLCDLTIDRLRWELGMKPIHTADHLKSEIIDPPESDGRRERP